MTTRGLAPIRILGNKAEQAEVEEESRRHRGRRNEPKTRATSKVESFAKGGVESIEAAAVTPALVDGYKWNKGPAQRGGAGSLKQQSPGMSINRIACERRERKGGKKLKHSKPSRGRIAARSRSDGF